MLINDFKKSLESIFGPCEWKAVKDGQVFQSTGWKEQTFKHEVKPSENHVKSKK